MKVLITGGSGFIGTNLINKLLTDKTAEVLSIDIRQPKIKEHLPIFRAVDICDYGKLEEIILSFSPDYVIHLGARTDLNGKTLRDYDANIHGVRNILQALENLTNLKRVLFASSMYVCEPGYIPKHFDDYNPHTVYGESKVQTEKIIKEKNPTYEWAIIRPTSIWGPYFGEPYNRFFKMVLSRKYFHMGERACEKTYGYIDNFIYQLLEILHAPVGKMNKQVFYLGDYDPYDISEWADEIAKEQNLRIPHVPFVLFRVLAIAGDILKKFGVDFPMTSFRLKNMTTDNVFDMSLIQEIAPNLPMNRKMGTANTVVWILKNQ